MGFSGHEDGWNENNVHGRIGSPSTAVSMAWHSGIKWARKLIFSYRQRNRERRRVQRGGEIDDAETGEGGIEAPSGIEFRRCRWCCSWWWGTIGIIILGLGLCCHWDLSRIVLAGLFLLDLLVVGKGVGGLCHGSMAVFIIMYKKQFKLQCKLSNVFSISGHRCSVL